MVPGMVEVTEGESKGKFFKTKNILIATGCKMRRIPDLEVDGARVMTSREALAIKTLPKSVVIVGAGAIGVEFAYFFNAFGSKVTLGRNASADSAGGGRRGGEDTSSLVGEARDRDSHGDEMREFPRRQRFGEAQSGEGRYLGRGRSGNSPVRRLASSRISKV